MSIDLADALVPIAAQLVVSTALVSPGRCETSRETFAFATLNRYDAAPQCANTKGPLTPPEPVRTSELS